MKTNQNIARPLAGFKNIKLKEVAKPEPIKHDKEYALQVANTIIQQLGGVNVLKRMIGAKGFGFESVGKVGVSFTFTAGRGVNFCRILLTPADLYNVELGYIRNFKYTKKFELEGAYDDMLKPFFEESTGLALSMPRIIGLNF